MSMHLWILRHGKAEPHRADDASRALVERGRHEAAAAGRWLAANGPRPQRVLCSPYVRARQTAEAALEALPELQIELVDWLVPDAQPMTVVKHLSAIFDSPLLLVSHQPLVSDLLSVLLRGEPGAGPVLGTASLAELELPLVAPGYGELRSLRHAPEFADAR